MNTNNTVTNNDNSNNITIKTCDNCGRQNRKSKQCSSPKLRCYDNEFWRPSPKLMNQTIKQLSTFKYQFLTINEQNKQLQNKFNKITELLKKFPISSTLDEYLPDNNKVECYELGYEDALIDITKKISSILEDEI